MDQIFKIVYNLIKCDGYASYDPYGGYNTAYAFLNRWYGLRLFLTYFNKFSPKNFRPALGIPKSRQNQFLAYIGLAIAKYDAFEYREDFAHFTEFIKFETLVEHRGRMLI